MDSSSLFLMDIQYGNSHDRACYCYRFLFVFLMLSLDNLGVGQIFRAVMVAIYSGAGRESPQSAPYVC